MRSPDEFQRAFDPEPGYHHDAAHETAPPVTNSPSTPPRPHRPPDTRDTSTFVEMESVSFTA